MLSQSCQIEALYACKYVVHTDGSEALLGFLTISNNIFVLSYFAFLAMQPCCPLAQRAALAEPGMVWMARNVEEHRQSK
jgi:hypothetical protein